MKHRFLMPPIPEAERTPLVIALLGVIEGLAAQVQKQEEEIALLKDEIRILKGGKKRPRFKPSKMDERTEENRRGEGGAQEDQRRAGSDKRSKTAELVIHAEQIIEPKRRIPKGSRFKGYRDIVRGGAGFSDTGISNGMDAPAWRGIKCAKVEVSSDHLNQQERPR